MIVGTVFVSACLLVLGWTKEIVAMFILDKELVSRIHEQITSSEPGLTMLRGVKLLLHLLCCRSMPLILLSMLCRPRVAL